MTENQIGKGIKMGATANKGEGVFQNYWREVQNQFSLDTEIKTPRHITKTDALSILRKIGDLNIETLFNALYHDDWKGRNEGKQKFGSNWIWRDKVDRERTKGDPEVLLERAIARTDREVWSYQMSTASGINDESGKCAIDLVRFNGNDSYSFVELKIGANNPVYAAFEILGYALAYLQARKHNWPSSNLGKHNVMNAKHIELVVLGHKSWDEEFAKGNHNLTFCWNDVAETLKTKINALQIVGVEFDFCFRTYCGDKELRDELVKEITAQQWTNCPKS